MQNLAWISLLRLMPAALHDKLMLVTRIGQEFTIQNIFRIEDDYLVVRGRMAGTTDAGRVIVIPYDEVHILGFQKPMKEADIAAIFGGQAPAAESAEQAAVDAADLTPEAPGAGEPVAASEPSPDVAAAEEAKPKPPTKGLLLERVRARLAASAQAKAAGSS